MNDSNYTLDFLPHHQEIKLYQHKKMFRINTDTGLLGNYLDFKKGSSVLDIGTNNGALLLYASILCPSLLVGIDINKEALSLAKTNLELNKIHNYQLLHIDLKDFNPNYLFDVILCNPPYFHNSYQNQNNHLRMARHDLYMPLNILFDKVSQLLSPKGTFYLVHRYERLEEIKNEIQKNHLIIQEQKNIDNDSIKPLSILLKIQKSE